MHICIYISYVYNCIHTRVLTCTNTCTYYTFTYSHTHMHTSTHRYTPMHPGKHIGTCADIHFHILHLRNHCHIGKPHENSRKSASNFPVDEIHDGHHSEVQRPRWCGSSTHFPEMEKGRFS